MKKRHLFLLLLTLLMATSCNKPKGNTIDFNENDTIMKKENNLAEEFNNAMHKAAPKPHFWNWKSVKERLKGKKPADTSRQSEEK